MAPLHAYSAVIPNYTSSPPFSSLPSSDNPSSPLDPLNLTSFISSESPTSFIVKVPLPSLSSFSFDVLIDCGASKSFIDHSITDTHANLKTPIFPLLPIKYFNGTVGAQQITHMLTTPLVFPDRTELSEQLLIMKMHPATPIMLGLSWLRAWNPLIDWVTLAMRFTHVERALN